MPAVISVGSVRWSLSGAANNRQILLLSVCPRCYSPSRFTEKAVATHATDSQHYEPMRATNEITNEEATNETAALGFDYFFFSLAINVSIQKPAKLKK